MMDAPAYALAADALARGYRLETFNTLDSTNSQAMRRARQNAAGRLWINAVEQTAGRGRLSRNWSSPKGNLHASLLLVSEVAPDNAPQLGFVAGVALVKALSSAIPSSIALSLKWPNDLLANGAKAAGILLEGAALPDGRFACVIGVGVNCASHPQDTTYPATDLAAQGVQLHPSDVLASLSFELSHWLDLWRAPNGFAAVREAWLANAAGLGKPLVVRSAQRDMHGLFKMIDASGRLVLETRDGEKIIDTGDVMMPDSSAPSGNNHKQKSQDLPDGG